MSESPLWTPDAGKARASHLARFHDLARSRSGQTLPDYDALWSWSIDDPEGFWSLLWDFAALRRAVEPTRVFEPRGMPGTRWFVDSRLNYAENLLKGAAERPDAPALIEVDEAGTERLVTWAQLADRARRFATYLQQRGVVAGDRVAAFLPNRAEAIVAMLGTAWIGAIWSSCSPDFGFQGVLDRFGQIQPKVLVACDGYRYHGKRFPTVDRVAQVAASIPSITDVVVVPVLGDVDLGPLPGRASRWADSLAAPPAGPALDVPFDHPLFILYSSGTTGVPKCIVHGHGGTLVQHAKEHLLHGDLHAGDVLFYFTTCGWMMWNWLASGLLAGATLVLFDGSPAFPDTGTLWRMAERHRVTHFGTSPKFLAACQKAAYHPGSAVDLATLRVVFSTGSPLSAELFHWVYDHVKRDVQLASICGGTDIISCFMGGSPIDPVYAGEIQKRGLGMAAEAWVGPNQPVVGAKGELVCVRPFPSMPVGFWNDPGDRKYRAAYFETFPGVWHHGDFVELTEHGGVIVHGRSDATLNPGGVRIGTAEIYRVVEDFPEIIDSVVIGQRDADDTRVVLFVVLRDGLALDDALTQRIRSAIRAACTPRHVPALVVQAPDVPRTISGKKVEIAVTRMVHHEPVANRDALANPGALDFYATALDGR